MLCQLSYAPMSDAGWTTREKACATAAVHIVLAPRVHDGLLGVTTTAKPLIGSAGFEPATLAVMQLCLWPTEIRSDDPDMFKERRARSLSERRASV